jgi:hypothetical protein
MRAASLNCRDLLTWKGEGSHASCRFIPLADSAATRARLPIGKFKIRRSIAPTGLLVR